MRILVLESDLRRRETVRVCTKFLQIAGKKFREVDWGFWARQIFRMRRIRAWGEIRLRGLLIRLLPSLPIYVYTSILFD